MGQPALIRQEGGAQYWRYRLAGCQLDLFLYAGPTDGSARVAYLDARAALGAPPESKRACADLARDLRAGVAPTELHPLPTDQRPALGSRLAGSSAGSGTRSASARRMLPEPRLAGCCWLGCGFQPAMNRMSKVAGTRPAASANCSP